MVSPLRFDSIEFYRTTEYPSGGVLSDYVTIAKNLALRNGKQKYYAYQNSVHKDSWTGGIIGIKTMLHCKSKDEAFSRLEILSKYNLVNYVYNSETRELFVHSIPEVNRYIKDSLPKTQCFATNHYGYIYLNRNLSDNLINNGYVFTEGDAYIDLMLHTVIGEHSNPFSYTSPCVMLNGNSILTLDMLGSRWHWEKTKVHRFFKKHSSDFVLRKCPGNFGCVIYNYSQTDNRVIPSQSDVNQIVSLCLYYGRKMKRLGNNNDHINHILKRNASCIISYMYHQKDTKLYHLIQLFYRPLLSKNNKKQKPLNKEKKKLPFNYFEVIESCYKNDTEHFHCVQSFAKIQHTNSCNTKINTSHFDFLVQRFFEIFDRPPD